MPELREQLQSTLGASYTFERELGGGGMARVFVATEASLGRRVVVKVLPPELAEGVSVDRFKREIQFAAQLQHAHIVPVLSAGDVDGLPYFTMPFVDGESLRARLARGELPMNDVVSILRDVARALDAAHTKGVIHRDIKPDNVLLSGGAAVVTDFGVAKAIASAASVGDSGETLTVHGIALGTPLYMAPEQAAADPRTDHRADVYAFGTMAYEMIAGRAPFAGRQRQQLAAAHATEAPTSVAQLRPSVPPTLAALVMRCLEKSPADRPQSAREILHALDSMVTPTAGSEATSARPWHRRASMLIVAASVVVAAVVAVPVYRRLSAPTLDPKRIIVLPFENLSRDSSLSHVGRVTAEWISDAVKELDSVRVISSLALPETSGQGGAANIRQLAQKAGAGTVVWGTYYRQGDSLRFQAQSMQVSTGTVQFSVDGVSGPASEPMTAIRTLGARLMGGLAMAPDSRGVQLGYVPPYEAYSEFVRGSELFHRQDYTAAIPHFRRAVEIDSVFDMARVMIGTSYGNLGRTAEADSILQILEAHRDRLGRWERLAVDYTRAAADGNQDAALQLMRDASARDSSTWLWLYLTGLTANNRNMPRLAIRALRAVTNPSPDSSWAPYWAGLATAHHALGDFKTELRVANHGDSLRPTRLFTQRLRATAALGDTASIRRLIDSAALASTNPDTRPRRMYEAFLELRAHDHPKEARDMLERLREWLAVSGSTKLPRPFFLEVTGNTLLAMGRFDSAYTYFVEYVRHDTTNNVSIHARVGGAAAKLGDTATAFRVMRDMEQVRRPHDQGQIELWRATIAAQLGDKDLAVRLLTQSFSKGQSTSQMHRLTELQSLKGYAPFEALLRPRG